MLDRRHDDVAIGQPAGQRRGLGRTVRDHGPTATTLTAGEQLRPPPRPPPALAALDPHATETRPVDHLAGRQPEGLGAALTSQDTPCGVEVVTADLDRLDRPLEAPHPPEAAGTVVPGLGYVVLVLLGADLTGRRVLEEVLREAAGVRRAHALVGVDVCAVLAVTAALFGVAVGHDLRPRDPGPGREVDVHRRLTDPPQRLHAGRRARVYVQVRGTAALKFFLPQTDQRHAPEPVVPAAELRDVRHPGRVGRSHREPLTGQGQRDHHRHPAALDLEVEQRREVDLSDRPHHVHPRLRRPLDDVAADAPDRPLRQLLRIQADGAGSDADREVQRQVVGVVVRVELAGRRRHQIRRRKP